MGSPVLVLDRAVVLEKVIEKMNKEFDEMFDKLLAVASIAEYKWRKFKLTKKTEKPLAELDTNRNDDVNNQENVDDLHKSSHDLLHMSGNSKSLITNINKKNVADLKKIDGVWTVRRPAIAQKKDYLPQSCHFCLKKMSTKSNLIRHIAMLHTELFSCDVCGKTEMDQISFDHHRRFRHRIGSSLRGSARKKTASLDSVVRNMRRHKIIEEEEMGGESGS